MAFCAHAAEFPERPPFPRTVRSERVWGEGNGVIIRIRFPRFRCLRQGAQQDFFLSALEQARLVAPGVIQAAEEVASEVSCEVSGFRSNTPDCWRARRRRSKPRVSVAAFVPFSAQTVHSVTI
jgi:hypothetical protein